MKAPKLILSISLAVVVASIAFVSCKKNAPQTQEILEQQPALPATPYVYADKHGVNSDLATLGRVLFYDKNLSANNAISCGGCHKQEFAFADNVKFNKGSNGLDLKRNSPSIQGIKGFSSNPRFEQVNGIWVPIGNPGMPNDQNQQKVLLFWDGRQNSVADMVLNPVLNHNEMNIPDFETLVSKLKIISYYPELFKKAFGDESITKEKIAYALEGFVACLNTDLTKENTGQNMNNFPTQITGDMSLEDQGKFLFHNKYNCARCHDPSNTGTYGTVVDVSQMFNIGLDEVYSDNGLGNITRKEGDKGLFKVPTLKNISLTAPYMHDGRFANLGEVIDHYSHNIKPNRNLTSLFLNDDGTPKRLNIVPAEKNALIAFLNTLRDDDFLSSPMYSDPFKK